MNLDENKSTKLTKITKIAKTSNHINNIINATHVPVSMNCGLIRNISHLFHTQVVRTTVRFVNLPFRRKVADY